MESLIFKLLVLIGCLEFDLLEKGVPDFAKTTSMLRNNGIRVMYCQPTVKVAIHRPHLYVVLLTTKLHKIH